MLMETPPQASRPAQARCDISLLVTQELNLEAAQNVLQIDSLLDLADLSKLPVRRLFPS